jgi:hypothetical protein
LPRWLRMAGPLLFERAAPWNTLSLPLSVVAGSFAAVIFGGYGIAQLIVSAL